jgi:hypothetical protein
MSAPEFRAEAETEPIDTKLLPTRWRGIGLY